MLQVQRPRGVTEAEVKGTVTDSSSKAPGGPLHAVVRQEWTPEHTLPGAHTSWRRASGGPGSRRTRSGVRGKVLTEQLTRTCPESEAAFATDVVKTLSAEAPTLATVTVVTSATQELDSAHSQGQGLPPGPRAATPKRASALATKDPQHSYTKCSRNISGPV